MVTINIKTDGTNTSVTVDGVPYVAVAESPSDEVIQETTAAPAPAGDEVAEGGDGAAPAASEVAPEGAPTGDGEGAAAPPAGDGEVTETTGEDVPA
ncbi:MAG: hypothetical protein WAP74_03380 [Patescibacteria group bacterium]